MWEIESPLEAYKLVMIINTMEVKYVETQTTQFNYQLKKKPQETLWFIEPQTCKSNWSAYDGLGKAVICKHL